jgi:antitoxin component YwqK of YwqJK toxin-antitoxin module
MASAQYKTFELSKNGDTLNAVDKNDMKQGKWINSMPELRGEPGYEEEGLYKNNEKTGLWRKYNLNGDLIAIENYRFGGKDGTQEYYSFLGNLERREQWRGYNPDAPYDTVAVYGEGNNEIIDYKIVKAQQYSVRHGEWEYFDGGGRIVKTENYDRGQLLKDPEPATAAAASPATKPKSKEKTKEILEYEKKYSKKKRAQMERDGKTSL